MNTRSSPPQSQSATTQGQEPAQAIPFTVCVKCDRLHCGTHNYCPYCLAEYQTEQYHSKRAFGNTEELAQRMSKVKVRMLGKECDVCGRALRGRMANVAEVDGDKVCPYCAAVVKLLGDEYNTDTFRLLVDKIINHRNEHAAAKDNVRFEPLRETVRTEERKRLQPGSGGAEWETGQWMPDAQRWADAKEYRERMLADPELAAFAPAAPTEE